MKLSNEKPSSSSFFSLSVIRKLALPTLALISITAGIVAGGIFRTNHKDSSAASANITVVDNDQLITVDQSTGELVITRSSAVTVKDLEARYGYILSVRMQNSLPSSAVTIYSSTSALCTEEIPCNLSTGYSQILETADNTATLEGGETITFTVVIKIPEGYAEVGDYVVDLEYVEEARIPADITSFTYMQEVGRDNCEVTPDRTRHTLIDRRNGQSYYIEKIGDLCWMESNLRYAGGGSYDSTWGWSDDRKTLAVVSGTNALSFSVAQYAVPTGGSADYTKTTAVGGFYGYLYNWCAAMGKQSSGCNSTSTSGFNTDVSICPAGWRLPTGGPSGEFQALVSYLGASTGPALNSSFRAVYSGGFYAAGLDYQGTQASMLSSTAYSGDRAYGMNYSATIINAASDHGKHGGFAVRCVR